MPGVVRAFDLTCGHCYFPTVPASFSTTVTANNRGVVRMGDTIVTHCCSSSCHNGNYMGFHNVTVENRPIQVMGDPVSCGDSCCQGSYTVTACGM